METIAKIRRQYYVDKKGYKTIARDLKLSKNTVKKVIKEDLLKTEYKRSEKKYRVLEGHTDYLSHSLEADSLEKKRRRRSAKQLYFEIMAQGYSGSYEAVNNFVNQWRRDKGVVKSGFVPLSFLPGEAFQFDWSQEEISLGGKIISIKVAHIRLCYSRFFLVRAYPNEQLEMLLDAHDQAFRFFGGSCRQGIYDNLKTVVTKIEVGKARIFNQRFLMLSSHYLFEPIACTPASGWEKGQVERQVALCRGHFFTPLCQVSSLEALNTQLEERCLSWAKTRPHPHIKEKTVWQMYEEERSHLQPCRTAFNACQVTGTVVSSCSLVHCDRNQYSVACHTVRQAVEIHRYVDRINIYHQAQCIGSHPRSFDQGGIFYDPWHYLPLLERKPGALRHGAPFRSWKLPLPLEQVRKHLSRYTDGEKQWIHILLQVKQQGLERVIEACHLSLKQGACTAAIILQQLQAPEAESKPVCEASFRVISCAPDASCLPYHQLYTTSTQAVCHG